MSAPDDPTLPEGQPPGAPGGGMTPRDDPAVKNGPAAAELGCLEKVAAVLDTAVSDAFEWLTTRITDWPKVTIAIVGVITAVLANGYWFFEENFSENQYAPEDSRALDEQAWVEARFPLDPRMGFVYFVADNGGSILSKESLVGMMEYHEWVSSELAASYKGTPLNYNNTCYRWKPDAPCATPSGILKLWGFNRSALDADDDVLGTINAPGAWRKVSPGGADLPAFLSRVERDAGGRIVSAAAAFMEYEFENVKDAKYRVDLETEKFELALNEGTYYGRLAEARKRGVSVYAWTHAAKEKADADAIDEELQLLVVGYILMIIFAIVVLSDGRLKYSQGSLAACSVLAIMMSTISAYGLCWYLGIKFNGIVQVLILVLLGLGIDDTFVIMNDWKSLSHIPDLNERLVKAMRHAGPAITLTSLTDVIAFLAGSATSLPALSDFCYYAALGIMIDFSYQVTFFVACTYLQSKRSAANRADFLCCMKVEEESAWCGLKCCIDTSQQYVQGAPGFGKKLWGVHYPRVLLSNPGRALAILISCAFVSLGAYGCTRIKMNLDTEWFVADGHPLQKTFEIRSRYFGGSRLTLNLWTREAMDYPNEQGVLREALLKKLPEVALVVPDSQSSWLFDFTAWVNATDPSAITTNTTTWSNGETETYEIVRPARFYELLRKFTNYDVDEKYHIHIPRVIWAKGGEGKVVATKNTFSIFDKPSRDGELAIDTIRHFRRLFDGTSLFVWAQVFVFWEGYGVMLSEMVRNVIITASCVFVISILFTANVVLGFFVMLNIGCIDVCLLGWMNLLGVDVNSVSVICVVLAVGLAVDYSVHIANSFVHAKATDTERFSARKQRAAYSLWKMGTSVALGGFSTFLAIFPLVAGKSYVFKVFFRMFAVIIFFGLWFGMVALPVVFSFVGPSPNANAIDLDANPQEMPLHDGDLWATPAPLPLAPAEPAELSSTVNKPEPDKQ